MNCRSCGAELTQTFLDLGEMPRANSYLDHPEDPDPRFPLHARICSACLLVQADATVAPIDLFSEYAFFSSMSPPWLRHCDRYVESVTQRFDLDEKSQVIEVASNDGCLLERFHGPKVLGIDPARNIAAEARVTTIPEFFTASLAESLPRADLLIANNVFGHVPDLNDFVAGLAGCLKDDGVLTIEVPWLGKLIAECEFDTIYHEHFSYFSLVALETILARHGLRVFDIDHLGVHGGSIRLYVSRHRQALECVGMTRKLEVAYGMYDADSDCYTMFADRASCHLKALRNFLDHAEGVVVGAGAPAKGNTLLNAVGATAADLEFVTDTSPHKQGKYLPGSHIPVVSPTEIGNPDTVVVLAWNWFDEIRRSLPIDAEFIHPLRLA